MLTSFRSHRYIHQIVLAVRFGQLVEQYIDTGFINSSRDARRRAAVNEISTGALGECRAPRGPLDIYDAGTAICAILHDARWHSHWTQTTIVEVRSGLRSASGCNTCKSSS